MFWYFPQAVPNIFMVKSVDLILFRGDLGGYLVKAT